MIITLNGYVINDGISPASLDTQITGLDLADIRTSSGNYSGRPGGYVGGQFAAIRDIGLQGRLSSSNVSTLETARIAFQTALISQPSGDQFLVTMNILTNAGHAYVVYTNLIDLDMPITQDLFKSPFQVELLATDVTIYDDTSGGALTANLAKLVSGGYTYPVVYPVIYSGGGSPTTITNSGTTEVFPIITLTGVMNNPVLTNSTVGGVFSLTGLITGAGDVVVIDMRQRIVTLNGSSIFALVGPLSSWWYLKPGANSVTLTTPNSGDTVTGIVSWRAGYQGI